MIRPERVGRRVRVMSVEGGGSLRRFFVTILILLGIALAAGALAVRTEGGRAWLAQRLARRLGDELVIAGARIAWPYALAIDLVESKGFRPDEAPGFKAQELRIGLTARGRWSVSAVRPVVHLIDDGAGNWRPAFFRRIGALPQRNLAELSLLTAGFRNRYRVEARDAAIRWIGADGTVMATAEGVNLLIEPVRLPGRKNMVYYRLEAENMRMADGTEALSVHREWLASEDSPYIELSASARDLPASLNPFWTGRETHPVTTPPSTPDEAPHVPAPAPPPPRREPYAPQPETWL